MGKIISIFKNLYYWISLIALSLNFDNIKQWYLEKKELDREVFAYNINQENMIYIYIILDSKLG